MNRYYGLVAFLCLMIAAGAMVFLRDPIAPTWNIGQTTTASLAPPPIEPAQPVEDANPLPIGSGFDFYVLSLSWSPSFCLSEAGAGKKQQCGSSKKYGMIAHGLWPQNERGYPAFCPSQRPDRVPDSLVQHYLDIMPDMNLIAHQWRKHGTCSGLSQTDYFRLTRTAFERVKLPDPLVEPDEEQDASPQTLEDVFMEANPGLEAKAIAVTCKSDQLQEVRICMTKDLKFRSCPEVDRQGCRLSSLSIPPTTN